MAPSLALLASALVFLDTFTVGLVNPIYPQLVQSQLLGATLYAATISAGNAGAFMAATFFGRLSDLYGRQNVICAACVTSFLGYACYVAGAACEGIGPTALRALLPAVGRVVSSVGREATKAPLLALISEDAAARSEDSTRRMAKTMAIFGFGFSFGSLAGGVLVGRGGGMRSSLALIMFCAALQVGFALLLPSNLKVKDTNEPAREETGWRVVLATAFESKEIRVLLLLQVCASGSFHLYDATAQLYLQRTLGYTSAQRGYILAFAGWMFAVQTFAVVPRLIRRWQASATLLLRISFMCIAAGRFGLAIASRLPPTPVLLVSYGGLNLGQGTTHTLLKGFMRDAAKPRCLGLMLGVLGSVERSVGVIAPLIAGPAYDRFGSAAPALLASVCGLCGCAVAGLRASTSATAKGKSD